MSRASRKIEQHNEDSFVAWCEGRGYKCKKLIEDERKGFPDRSVFLDGGRSVIIEFKAPGGTVSHHQREQIKDLKKLGHSVHVAFSCEEAIQIVEGVLANG